MSPNQGFTNGQIPSGAPKWENVNIIRWSQLGLNSQNVTRDLVEHLKVLVDNGHLKRRNVNQRWTRRWRSVAKSDLPDLCWKIHMAMSQNPGTRVVPGWYPDGHSWLVDVDSTSTFDPSPYPNSKVYSRAETADHWPVLSDLDPASFPYASTLL